MALENLIHHQLNQLLNDTLAEGNTRAPTGTRLSFGVSDEDISGELQFVVESPSKPQCESTLAAVLNRGNPERLVDNFVALEQHCAREQAEIHLAEGNGPKKQIFALKFDGTTWQLDLTFQAISLDTTRH